MWLLGEIGDGSQLSLDPELDTYHLMLLTVTFGPQYAEYLTRLRDLAALTLKDGEGKAMPPQRLRAMERNATLIAYVDPLYESSYGKGIEAFSSVASTMDMKSAMPQQPCAHAGTASKRSRRGDRKAVND